MPTASLTTSTLAVMAFVVAFYALIARERKTPNITVYIFSPSVLLVLALVTSVLDQMLRSSDRTGVRQTGALFGSTVLFSQTDIILNYLTEAFLLVGILWVALNIWRLHNRQVNFRDDHLFRNIRAYRYTRQVWNRIKPSHSYEYQPEMIDKNQLVQALNNAGFDVDDPAEPPTTLALCEFPLKESDKQSGKLIAELLQHGWQIQYTTCARHPYEWIDRISSNLPNPVSYLAKQVVVVDGYTTHFAFTDSIHIVKTADLMKKGISYHATRQSFAGIHTATAKAFNALKRKSNSTVRKPTLLIYEGCRSLIDLESIEQYRIFIRHVITSERMWGGMVTLWIEPESDKASVQLFNTYCEFVYTYKLEAKGGSPS